MFEYCTDDKDENACGTRPASASGSALVDDGAGGSDGATTKTLIEDEIGVVESDSDIETNDCDEEENEIEATANILKKRKTTPKIPPARWNHCAVLSMIEAYRLNMPLFLNQAIRNNIVWEKIRIKLAESNFNYTRKQIITKFKYLKKLYIEKKDNMGPKTTGQPPLDFEFFEEFDELFSEKPNIIPVCVVSSDVPGSAQPENLADIEEPAEKQPVHETEKLVPKKRPRSKKTVVAVLQEMQKERKERHEDMLLRMEAMNDRSCNVFEEAMKKLIEKM